MQKILSVLMLAVAVSMITAVTFDHSNVLAKGKPAPKVKCNNVKILVKVTNIPANTTAVTASVTLNGKTVSKTQTLDENDTSIAVPLLFKKLNPCPAPGDSFTGDVNGTAFSGTISSLKKPNKVKVSL